MRYLPHTREEIAAMLKETGAGSLEDLFSTIPANCRFTGKPNLPEPLTEWEAGDLLGDVSRMNATPPKYKVFMGAGSYRHHIPASVSYLLNRSEFSTAYTPYQPEISQGTLQGIYEYQTLVEKLLGMEIANASMYDGATALAEALLMAIRITQKKTVAVSRLIHPHYRQVIQTYFKPTDYEIVELPYLKDGRTGISSLEGKTGLAALVVQSPNFFGCIENLQSVSEMSQKTGALFIISFAEPIAFGLLKSPGSYGADIVCGEGQSLGIPQSFGGPGLGMFASRMKYARNMPGRLVGKTQDMDGRRGFVLTLATREQHIRREKATSNICTNASLNALSAAMYMASLGGTGIRELAKLNHDKCEYLKKSLKSTGARIPFSGPTFNEFVVKFPSGFDSTYARLFEKQIIAGLPLATYYPELNGHYLLCVTEVMTRQDMDTLVKEIG